MTSMELRGLTKSFRGTRAIQGLDLTVRDGEYLCLLGPTGAGKTTTLRLVAGLIDPDSGSIEFDGRDVTRVLPEERGASMMSQTYALFPHMDVGENISFGPYILGWDEVDRRNLLSSLLDMVHLTNRIEAYPHELSGGMQQRTALARALGSGADILLLDEPLRALDARLRIQLRQELKSLATNLGKTVIHVTHDQEEAMVMADRIAVIRDGRIVQIGTPREIFARPETPFVANFLGQSNFIEGTVTAIDGELMRIAHDNVGELPCRTGPMGVGEKAVMGIKVGNTRLVEPLEGFFKGVVERVVYEGKMVHMDVYVSGVGRVSAKIPNRKRGAPVEGDIVGVAWDPDESTTFRMPEDGIEHELRVE